MLPEDVVQADLHNGQLQALLPEYALPSRPIYLLCLGNGTCADPAVVH